jgi:hypothetical protein
MLAQNLQINLTGVKGIWVKLIHGVKLATLDLFAAKFLVNKAPGFVIQLDGVIGL